MGAMVCDELEDTAREFEGQIDAVENQVDGRRFWFRVL